MERAQAVSKARMFRRLIREKRESELFDAPQTLEFRRVDEAHEKFPRVRIGFEPNNIMNRIAVDFFRQVFLRKKIVQSSRRSVNSERIVPTDESLFYIRVDSKTEKCLLRIDYRFDGVFNRIGNI